MAYLFKLYKLVNILSIDVALGAIAGALFFAKLVHVQIRPYGLATLGLTVWCIYTFDHLMDAKKIKAKASTQRHLFHQQHFKKIAAILFACLLLNASLVFFIREIVFKWGLLLLGIVLLYFIVHRQLKYLKEIFAAIVYTTGIVMISLSVTSIKLNGWHGLLLLMYFLTALINLILFSWFGYKQDLVDKHISLMSYLPNSIIKKILFFLLATQSVIFIFLLNSDFAIAAAVIYFMNLILATLLIYKNYFILNDRYRYVGDAIFIIPFLYELV